ncbi:MAG TPA: C40 family peptidase [Chitinophagaceae bacterium]|nr:C40 family peptidase [Chitinophagaceae bacterium]
MCRLIIVMIAVMLSACGQMQKPAGEDVVYSSSTLSTTDSFPAFSDSGAINTRAVKPGELVAFAQSLTGTPYKYASSDPAAGFDCSGFITYVFNHFGIEVPRSSIDFTHTGREVNTSQARPGDLILFTGTDSTIKVVGHMGIVTGADGTGNLQFIHSTSGKAYGVTTTPLNEYYRSRFVKVIRVFPD